MVGYLGFIILTDMISNATLQMRVVARRQLLAS
jgi:hypothetical protein